jgi:hypothetical protein
MANVEIDQLPPTQVVRLLNGKWILAVDGSATFANGQLTFDAAGNISGKSISINGGVAQILATGAAQFANGDILLNDTGSASFAGGTIIFDAGGNVSLSGAIFLNADGSASFGGGQLTLAANGDITDLNGFGVAAGIIGGLGMLVLGDIEITSNLKGLILKSPNGTRFRLRVGDAGELGTEPA